MPGPGGPPRESYGSSRSVTVLVIGHRGASALAPENTLPAFDRALALGAAGIEVDLRATRDGIIVALHDATLDRATDGCCSLRSQPWAVVRRLDAGRWFGPEFAGTRIPTLDDVLDRYVDRCILCFEVKEPRAGLGLVHRLRRRGLTHHPGLRVICFAWPATWLLHAALPGLAAGHLVHRLDERAIARAASAGIAMVLPRAASVTAPLVALAHDRAVEIWAWDVAGPVVCQRLAARGADAAIVDDPSWGAALGG